VGTIQAEQRALHQVMLPHQIYQAMRTSTPMLNMPMPPTPIVLPTCLSATRKKSPTTTNDRNKINKPPKFDVIYAAEIAFYAIPKNLLIN
jgi:hypothetical protein